MKSARLYFKIFSLHLTLLIMTEWPLWIMRCSRGSRDNRSSSENGRRDEGDSTTDKEVHCVHFPAQRKDSSRLTGWRARCASALIINSKSLWMLSGKVTQRWRGTDEQEMTVGLKDTAWLGLTHFGPHLSSERRNRYRFRCKNPTCTWESWHVRIWTLSVYEWVGVDECGGWKRL